MKKFLIATLLASLFILGTVGVASAHTSRPLTCATDRANLINALNFDDAEDSITPDGVVTDSSDISLANARAQLIANGCTSGTGGFVPGFRFPGGFGFGFGVNTASGDPSLCQDILNFLAGRDIQDQRQFASAGLSARLQVCAAGQGSVTSPVAPTSPFGFCPPGFFRFGFQCVIE